MWAHDNVTGSRTSQGVCLASKQRKFVKIVDKLWNNSSQMDGRLHDVRQKLSKKATFEQALVALQQILVESPELSRDVEFSATLQRSFTLLKTRYTAPAFWSAGKKLYQAVKVRHGYSSQTKGQMRWKNDDALWCYPPRRQILLQRLEGQIVIPASTTYSTFCWIITGSD